MTGNAHSGHRILGRLRSADGQGVVRIEDRYDTGIDDLWSAIVDPAAWPAGTAGSRATSAWAGSSGCSSTARAGTASAG